MPVHGTRGMGLIAEAGESPQSRLYGSTSAHSTQNINTNDSDGQSLFVITSLIFPSSNVFLSIYGIHKYLTTNFNNDIDSVFISIVILFSNLFISYIFVFDPGYFWANGTDGVSHG